MKLRTITLSLALLAISVAAQAATVHHSVKVGELRCNISGGLGLIVTSKKTMKCDFKSVKGHSETYEGTITKFGIDIGATNGGILAWDVFAPTSGAKRKALAGQYGGADASIAIGVGLGANVLVGGSKRMIALQPVSVEVQSGIALAAGVESMSLLSSK